MKKQGNATKKRNSPKNSGGNSAKSESSGNKSRSGGNKVRANNTRQQFDNRPQKMSKKSNTGSSYNDGFDVVSRPERDLVRVEQFDELIGTVTGQTAFTCLPYVCNPGNSTTFPRLSIFAKLYERYEFESLEFYFQHDVSQYNVQGAAGLVILSGLYDAASPTPLNKNQVEVTDPHVICMPNQNSLMRFNKKKLHPQGMPLFVRPGNLPGGADIKTYDCANMFLTVQGMAGAGEVGELHCRGRVKFYGDILDASQIQTPINNQVAEFVSSGNESLTSTVELLLALATSRTNGLNAVNTAGSIVLPAGNYMVYASNRAVFAGSGTTHSLSIYKNAVGIGEGAGSRVWVAAQLTTDSLVHYGYVTVNGTDAITVGVTTTFSTSTCVALGSIIIVAV